MKTWGRGLVALAFVAALVSACTDRVTNDRGPSPTGPPRATSSAVPTSAAPSPSVSLGPSPVVDPTSAAPTAAPTAARLCDTKVEGANPVLRGVRFGRHSTYDRLAFDFCAPADATFDVKQVEQLTEDGSGDPVDLDGAYFFLLTLTPADAHTSAGRPTVPRAAVTVPGGNMRQYQLIGDFEGVVTYGLGVRRLAETSSALQTDPQDPRHVIFTFDLGPQTG